MKKRQFIIFLLIACIFFSMQSSVCAAGKAKGIIRVLLTRFNLTDRVDLALDGSYTIQGIAFQRGSHVTISSSKGTLMLYYEGMAQDCGKEMTLLRHAVSENEENGLRINGEMNLYCGDLHLYAEKGLIQAVLNIPVEEYLLGVVPYEMSDSFPLEALKAQAVAARTYAMKKASNGSGRYDIVDNTNDQVFRGYNAANKNALQAVNLTQGICGYYRNELAICYYTASNGGQVEIPENVWGSKYGYITLHDDPYDVENPESPVKRATVRKQDSEGLVYNMELTDYIKSQLSDLLLSRGYTGDPSEVWIDAVLGIRCERDGKRPESKIPASMVFSLKVSAFKELSAAAMDTEEVELFDIGKQSEHTGEYREPIRNFIALEEPV